LRSVSGGSNSKVQTNGPYKALKGLAALANPLITFGSPKGDVHVDLEGDIIGGKAKDQNPNKVDET
jgi:hypothetical protein